MLPDLNNRSNAKDGVTVLAGAVMLIVGSYMACGPILCGAILMIIGTTLIFFAAREAIARDKRHDATDEI